jgi:hypothetical protein
MHVIRRFRLPRAVVAVLSLSAFIAAFAASARLLIAQGGFTATGGFIEAGTSTASRAPLTAAQAAAFLPARGVFRFPAPYNTTGIRLTNSTDCGGQDCVRPVGYSYWSNINNHVGSDTMLIFLGLRRERGGAGPTLFSVNKQTGETRNLGPVFASTSSWSWATGEGWYFSHTQPNTLYVNSGPRLYRYNVQTRVFTTVLDVTTPFGANRSIWQIHSSADDRVHSATLQDGSYARLGCVAYREDTQQWYFAPRIGTYDECQIDKSGRWLVIKEQVDGRNKEDNRVIDLQTGTERVLLDENGAGGHSDMGFGYMVAADDYSPAPAAVRTWRFDLSVAGGEPTASVAGQGTLVYRQPYWGAGMGHVAHGNARSGAPDQQMACNSHATRVLYPRANEIVCYRLNGRLDVLVVAPNLVALNASGGGDEYSKLPKGNLDVTGEYFIWTGNAGGNRLDAYLVRIPTALLGINAPPSGGGTEPVRWVSLVNASASSGTLRKTGGCSGCADAGAASEQRIASGGGSVQVTASDIAPSRTFGLSVGNTGTSAEEIRYGIRLSSGYAEVRESGVYKSDRTFVSGDRFEVRLSGGVVSYLKNGTAFYTSSRSVSYPMLVDASLSTAGATLNDAVFRPLP